jgi:hypothetical protein
MTKIYRTTLSELRKALKENVKSVYSGDKEDEEQLDESSTKKPGIIVLSSDSDRQGFKWLSDGWNTIKSPNRSLFEKAGACIEAGKDVPDVIRRLKAAGFSITRRRP